MSSFNTRPTAQLVEIVAAGGGLVLDAQTRPTADLVQIASASKKTGGQIVFRGMNTRPNADLVQIAAAGSGRVQFVGDVFS